MTEIVEPRLTLLPAPGFWLITVPMLLHELPTTLLTVPSTRPAACMVRSGLLIDRGAPVPALLLVLTGTRSVGSGRS